MTPLHDRRGRPLQDLRISITDQCNFRCTYCLPKEIFGDAYPFLPPDQILDTGEILRAVRIIAGLGVRKVKLTGGEPLLSPRILDLVGGLAAIPAIEDVGLITNGFYLERLAPRLWDAGLRRINVSLDSLDPERFGLMNGRGAGLDRVLAGITAAWETGFRPLKINMVVQRGVNDQDILAVAERFRHPGMMVRFIEFMDTGTVPWSRDQVVPSSEIVEQVGARWPLVAEAPRHPGEVATRWAYADGQGHIGCIASVTKPFCGACSRLRLGPDGQVHTCLFAPASRGFDLRALLRDGSDDSTVSQALGALWGRRDDRYSEERSLVRESAGREAAQAMYYLGG